MFELIKAPSSARNSRFVRVCVGALYLAIATVAKLMKV